MRRIKVFVTMSLLLLLVSMGAWAQGNIKVSGRITDVNGEPLPSVTVYEAGKPSNGTVSDSKGNYSISVPESALVVFSCLGYVEMESRVPKRGVINVVMEDEVISLEAAEVVEIGYGSVARRDLTGAVGRADVGSILKTSAPSVDQALAGRLAGVVVSTTDGGVGTESDIVIRGISSLTQSTGPLYVIDGFQTESAFLSSLNPADIESIDVLKDASATAIYGARGANGVIIINTKQGIEGKPKVSFSASWSGTKIAHKMDLMDAYDFVEMEIEMGYSSMYLKGDDGQTFTLEDYRNANTIDWQDASYRNALIQNYSISVSGGIKSSGTIYDVSFSALDQNGILLNSNFQRYQGRVKLTQNIGNRVRMDLNINYYRTLTNGSKPADISSSSNAANWLLYSMWGYRPVKPLGVSMSDEEYFVSGADEGIDVSQRDSRFNPVLTLRNEYKKYTQDRLSAQIALNYTIIPGLVLRADGTYSLFEGRQEAFNNSMTSSGWSGSTSGRGVNASIYWTRYVDWQNNETLTWTKHIRNTHHLTLMGGVTFRGQNRNYQGVAAAQLTNEDMGLLGMNSGNYQTVSPYERDWTLMSGLFRLQYNYKYKYYLTASFRADGSSKFAEGHRWGYFPSAALSWTFKREKWLSKAKWLTNGKLRASWGMTGNNNTSTPYDYYPIITTSPGTTSSRDYVFGGTIVPGYYPSNMGNSDLKWETTEQWDVGLDLAFFKKDRIKLTVDWYLKNTRDLLLNATVPASTGFTTCMMNIGSLRNSGVEITLETLNINARNFQWTTNFNISFNKNIVTALSGDESTLLSTVSWDSNFNSQYAYITQVGKPAGMMYGFIYEGTYKPADFNGSLLKNGIPYLSSVGQTNVKPGDPKYRDINGDGVVDDNDRTIIGCGQPLHTGGFNNSFYFYGFDINVFFSWSYGNDIMNANRYIFEGSPNRNHLNQLKSYVNRYSESNPDSDIPAVKANGMTLYSSRVIEDGSFLRLKNVSLGYTIPAEVLKKARISSIRVYVSADNIWTCTKYSGPDPEVSVQKSALTPGFDWSAYPRALGFTGGFSLNF